MFINKTKDKQNNLCGAIIAELRTSKNLSQRALAEQLQLHGLVIDKNAIQRIESGKRFVTDIELSVLADFFETSCDRLLGRK